MSSAGQDPNSPQTHDQWIRKVGLLVSNDSGKGLDLSAMRVHFNVNQSDFETPNNAIIRVYNLSTQTIQQIKKEFTQVSLQAGYRDGAYGIIFNGTIKQSKSGREDQANTFLDIYAADSDKAYNFGTVSMAVAAGTSPEAQTEMLAKGMGAGVGNIQYNTGLQKNIRGKVLYGMTRSKLRNLARTGGATWSLQDGKVVVSPLTGYASGEAVVLNSATGMIGLPEQTEDGIKIRCLLNPKIVIGTQVQIDQASVQRASVSLNPTEVNQFENAFPPVTDDGFYYVMVAEHEGDTRDNAYYSNLTCLSIDKTSPQNQSVQPAG